MAPRFILIVGSADKCCDSTKLATATKFVRAVTAEILHSGNSVSVLATRESVRVEDGKTVPLVFDWVVLRAVEEYLEHREGRANYRMARVFMGVDSMAKRFSSDNASLIQRLQSAGAIDVKHIEESLYSGGEYRDWQAEYCDGMIAIGGGGGTYQIADKMLALKKPVMPMDILIGARHRDGEGSIQLLEEMKTDEQAFLPKTHQVVSSNLYCLSLEQPCWPLERIARTTSQILSSETEGPREGEQKHQGRIKSLLLKCLGKSPQVLQSAFHGSKTAESIGRLFD